MGGKGFLRGVFGPETGAQRGTLGAVLGPGGRGADRLPLSFQTQAEGDALRPRGRCTAPRKTRARRPGPAASPAGPSAGSRGSPAALAGGRAGRCPDRRWEGLGGRLPSAPGGRASGPTVRTREPGAAACASRSPALSPGVTGAADPSAALAALQGSAQGGRAAAPWCPWERALPPARLHGRPHHAL